MWGLTSFEQFIKNNLLACERLRSLLPKLNSQLAVLRQLLFESLNDWTLMMEAPQDTAFAFTNVLCITNQDHVELVLSFIHLKESLSY